MNLLRNNNLYSAFTVFIFIISVLNEGFNCTPIRTHNAFENMSVNWCSKPLLTNGEDNWNIFIFYSLIWKWSMWNDHKNITNDDDDDDDVLVVVVFFLREGIAITQFSKFLNWKEWNNWNFRVFYVFIYNFSGETLTVTRENDE